MGSGAVPDGVMRRIPVSRLQGEKASRAGKNPVGIRPAPGQTEQKAPGFPAAPHASGGAGLDQGQWGNRSRCGAGEGAV